jgi:hypothetical protein
MPNTVRTVYNETWVWRIHAKRPGEDKDYVHERVTAYTELQLRERVAGRLKFLREENPNTKFWAVEDLVMPHESKAR